MALLSVSAGAKEAPDTRFSCGGSIEEEVWKEWDADMRDYLQQHLLQKLLIKQGDTYALYDFQMYIHDLVAMARRCDRKNRMREIARMIRIAYGELKPGTYFSPGSRWICRRGNRCSAGVTGATLGNGEAEGMLYSVQFLGVASSVANALASSDAALGEEEKVFINDTVRIAMEHLRRWGGEDEIASMQRNIEAAPKDVKNGSSSLFFTDRHLWMITIYAELAGILGARDRHGLKDARIDSVDQAHQDRHLKVLLEFFNVRVSFLRSAKGKFKDMELADLDRGYWRLFSTMRYAGYEKEEKPAVCVPAKTGNPKLEVRVPPESVPVREDTGWDISHARRLVPAMDALERNREALKKIFGLKESQLPAKTLPSAFANTLVAVIWNGDTTKPLFSNYWSGANGWYRVAYRRGSGKCNEGHPPYFLTGAFPTGGYIAWARYNPIIGELGKTLYKMMNDSGEESSAFIERYYPILAKSKRGNKEALSRFMFMSSLVGVARK